MSVEGSVSEDVGGDIARQNSVKLRSPSVAELKATDLIKDSVASGMAEYMGALVEISSESMPLLDEASGLEDELLPC